MSFEIRIQDRHCDQYLINKYFNSSHFSTYLQIMAFAMINASACVTDMFKILHSMSVSSAQFYKILQGIFSCSSLTDEYAVRLNRLKTFEKGFLNGFSSTKTSSSFILQFFYLVWNCFKSNSWKIHLTLHRLQKNCR